MKTARQRLLGSPKPPVKPIAQAERQSTSPRHPKKRRNLPCPRRRRQSACRGAGQDDKRSAAGRRWRDARFRLPSAFAGRTVPTWAVQTPTLIKNDPVPGGTPAPSGYLLRASTASKREAGFLGRGSHRDRAAMRLGDSGRCADRAPGLAGSDALRPEKWLKQPFHGRWGIGGRRGTHSSSSSRLVAAWIRTGSSARRKRRHYQQV